MEIEAFISLCGIAFAAGITPGPNNALLANSGATFGLPRTVPHALGVTLGYVFMIICISLGLGTLFEASQILQTIMQWISVALLIWISYKIGTSGSLSYGKNKPRPFTFLEAAAFQWINPKAWAMGISIISQFVTTQQLWTTSLILAVVFLATGLISTFTWAGLGQALQHWLKVGQRLRWFNRTMALTILLSVALLLIEH